MIEIVRADTLRGFCAFVAELGGDGDMLLHEIHLDPETLADGDAYISFRAVAKLMERAAAVLDCPDFGMRLSQRRGEDALGPLAVAMMNAETVRAAIGYAERFMHFQNLTLRARLEPAEEEGCEFLSLEHRLSRPMRIVQSAERMLCFAARFMAFISSAPPRAVWFRHARVAPQAAYRAAFVTPVLRFSAPHQGLLVESAVLEAPRAAADAQLKRIAEHFLENMVPPLDARVSSRARSVVDRMMRLGDCTQLDLARALGLHERTLQRRLQAEGTTFESIKDEVRRDMARGFLAQPGMPLSRIAEILGYAETSALTRSCHRWFGMAPRDLRKQLLAEDAA